jgi:ribosomal protein S18 acetylase RimI-like enzyme
MFLKDGREVEIRKPSDKDFFDIKGFRNFINSLIEENVLILFHREKSIKSERRWLKRQLNRIEEKKSVMLIVKYKDKMVGQVDINLGPGRKEYVGTYGISISKDFRGLGLGSHLTSKILEMAKNELEPKPRMIKLGVFSINKPAIALYEKHGFKKVAVLPEQFIYNDKFQDETIMFLYL